MTITARISLIFLVISGIGFYFFARQEIGETTRRYREATEEPLVDFSTVLANIVVAETLEDTTGGTLKFSKLASALSFTNNLPVVARIYQLEKKNVDIRVYLTNDLGIVIFDSLGRDAGKDFSKWNDVAETLAGRYGARSSHVEEHASGSILHVASPIVIDGKIRGSLTVAKPNHNSNLFIKDAKDTTLIVGVVCFLAVATLAGALSQIVTRPIRALIKYAKEVSDGKRVSLSQFGTGEIRALANAFEEMRDALEGRKYVEHYVQALTHEIKSPLTSIRGAAELLREDPPGEVKEQFLSNIESEVERAHDLIEKLLSLSALQRKTGVQHLEEVNINTLLEECLSRIKIAVAKKKILIQMSCPDDVIVFGDRFWLAQALSNVIQNGIEFSPEGKELTISASRSEGKIIVTVADQGPGIPEWALGKVLDSFYSLPRPDTNKRSSGLGLTIVKEVLSLHQGTIKVANRPHGGAEVTLEIPHRPQR
jgi:two-component system sensor histidine kinase CreC